VAENFKDFIDRKKKEIFNPILPGPGGSGGGASGGGASGGGAYGSKPKKSLPVSDLENPTEPATIGGGAYSSGTKQDVIPKGNIKPNAVVTQAQEVTNEGDQYSFWGATKQTIKNLGKVYIIGPEGDFGNYYNQLSEPYGSYFSPDMPNVNPTWRGTTIKGSQPPGYVSTKGTTAAKFQMIQQDAGGLNPKYWGTTPAALAGGIGEDLSKNIQSKLDSGEITTEEEANKQFTEGFKTEFKPTDVSSYGKIKGSAKPIVQLAIDTAFFSVIGLIPEVRIAGDILTFKTSTKGTALFKPNSYMARVERMEEFALLEKQRIKIEGPELIKTDEGGFIKVHGSRSTNRITQEVHFDVPYFKGSTKGTYGTTESIDKTIIDSFGKKRIIKQPGKEVLINKPTEFATNRIKDLKVDTRFSSFVTDTLYKDTLKSSGGARIKATGNIVRAGKNGLMTGTKELTGGTGSGYLKIGDKIKTFKISGFSRETETGYSVVSGTPNKIRFGEDTITIRGKIDTYGEITKAPIFKIDNNIGSGISLTGGSSIGTIQIQKNIAPIAIPDITKQSLKEGAIQIPKNIAPIAIPDITKQSLKEGAIQIQGTTTIKDNGLKLFTGNLNYGQRTQQKKIQTPTFISSTIGIQKQEQKEIYKTATLVYGTKTKQQHGQIAIPTFNYPTPTKQTTKQTNFIPIGFLTPRIPRPPTDFTMPKTPPPFYFKLGSLDKFNFGSAFKGANKITKEAPSFSAIIYNIRGKKRKSDKSGLTFRPITKEFFKLK